MSFKVDSGLSNSSVHGNPVSVKRRLITLYRQRSAESTHLTAHRLVRMAGITDKRESKFAMIAKTDEKGRSGNKKRISVPSLFLSSPLFTLYFALRAAPSV